MTGCRNCGSDATSDLGSIGVVAPFFLKRVLDLELGLAPSMHPLKRFLRTVTPIRKASNRIYGSSVLMHVQYCRACSFIQTKLPVPEDKLSNLYVDYRSDSYNRERIRYEPAYAAIASQVGASSREVDVRKKGLVTFLKAHLDFEAQYSILDYGGADGKFLPDLPGKKHVYDVSDIEPIPGIERLRAESELGTYSYIQIAHVLEHVPYPLALARKACSYLEPGGYVYIELPQDLSEEFVAKVGRSEDGVSVPIHEHINFYVLGSAVRLLQAIGLSVVDAIVEDADIGWTKARLIRVLGRRQADWLARA